MNDISFTPRWDRQRWAAIMEEVSVKNTDFRVSTALQFYFGTIIRKKQFELTPDLIEIYSKYTIVDKNDIIVNGLNLNYDFVSQRVGIVKEQGIITSAYLSMRVRSKYNPNYYCFLLKTMDAKKIFHGMGTGVRLTLSYKELRNFLLPVPPRDEQDQIVRFLDWKVSEINKLINIKWKEIERLEELKKAVISRAITCGLNPSAEIKDSGVNWLGMIPKHWEISKLKWLCNMKSGTNLVSQDISPDSGAYLVYGGNGIRGYYNDYNTDGKYLLVGRQGALCGNVHKGNGKIWATDHAVVTRTNFKLDINYAFYLLTHMNLNQYANDAAAQPGLAVGRIINLITVVPPIVEQVSIAEYLDSKCDGIDNIIDRKRAHIKALHELKSRLVSDVVTGKIDVRDIDIPDYEYIEEEVSGALKDEEELQDDLEEV